MLPLSLVDKSLSLPECCKPRVDCVPNRYRLNKRSITGLDDLKLKLGEGNKLISECCEHKGEVDFTDYFLHV